MTRDRQFDPVLAAQGHHELAPPIGTADLDILFSTCLRFPSFFDEATGFVQPHHFTPAEQHFALLWAVMIDVRTRFRDFVRATVYDLVHRAVCEAGPLVSDSMRDELLRQDNNGIVYSAFATPIEDFQLDYTRDIMRRFMEERTLVRPLQRLAQVGLQPGSNGAYAASFSSFLTEIGEHQRRVQGIAALPYVETVPSREAVFRPSSTYHLTGVPFIDGPLGGQREGDANGLVGVTGGGKSTLAAHLVVSSGRISFAEATLARSNNIPISALFTYEESALKIYPRIQSAGMQIRRQKLERMQTYEELTTRENMEDYERALVAPGGEALCERERWDLNRAWMNRTVTLFDMSGSEAFPSAGYGYVPEMANALDRRVQALGSPVRTVVIDWAGLVCQRHLAATGEDDKKLRRKLEEMGDDLRRLIAERFRCTVWLVHQLRGEAGAKSPVKLMHHTDAGESKTFATNLSTVGCLGVPDPRTGCRRLNWSKVRYTSQEQVTAVTLRINDMFATMDDVTAQFSVDEANSGFASRDAVSRIAGGTQQRQQARGATSPDDAPNIRGHGSSYQASDGDQF